MLRGLFRRKPCVHDWVKKDIARIEDGVQGWYRHGTESADFCPKCGRTERSGDVTWDEWRQWLPLKK